IVLKDIAPGTPSGLFALGGGVDPTVPGGEVLLFLDAPSGGTQVLHGFVGAVEYITLTINTSTGEFEVVQHFPLFHPDHNDTEDNLLLDIDFIATDSTGDPLTATLHLSFDDDSPVVQSSEGPGALIVDESVGKDAGDPN